MKFIKKQILKENVEEIKEELVESVDKKRSYDCDTVPQVIAQVLEQHGYVVTDDSDQETDLSQKIIQFEDIEKEFRYINNNGSEIQAEDVDNALETLIKYFKLEPEEVKLIEDAINKSHGNAAADRKDEFEEDIRTLEEIIENSLSKDEYDYYQNDSEEDENSPDKKVQKYEYKIRLFSPKVIRAVENLIYELEHSNYTGLEKE